MRARAIGQLIAFLAIVATAPAILRLSRERQNPDAEYSHRTDLEWEREQLRDANPEVLFIGNSMLYTRIDRELFQRESGLRCAWISNAGSASAAWFLALKNILVPSGARPKIVIVFFRDQYLTYPGFRTTGFFRPYYESLQLPEEPVLQQVFSRPAEERQGLQTRIAQGVAQLYGIEKEPEEFQARLRDLSLDLTGFGQKKRDRRDYMGERFVLEALRHDLAADTAEDASGDAGDDDVPRRFDPGPGASFLPHMIQLAKDHDLRLCFYRVKRRVDVDESRPYSRSLPVYMDALRDYLEANGALLIDESGDDIPASWYADGDHIDEEHRPAYNAFFWKKVRRLFP